MDTFQMALTFMSDPKEASVSRIKKYILDHYHQDVDPDKYACCLLLSIGYAVVSLQVA
jgi:hypothetical protein